ncbi:MAG: fused MFS/spermidine synthase [Mariprofundales bacterium]|nr:fused MFS/spermidine synthase [Mariprofundales bacterium]
MPIYLIINTLYAASGITALAYEVLWMRPIGLLFGISNFGVVVTVSAFMAGLGLGSLLGARLNPTARQALQAFAALELAVALFALLLPWMLPLLDHTLLHVAGGIDIGHWQGLEFLVSGLLLLVPASALGLAFPLMMRVARAADCSVGLIYGVNVLGGVAGALLPLWLLPQFGWSQALQLVALLGALIALSAWWSAAYLMSASRFSITTEATLGSAPPMVDLLAYAGIGAGALMLEIAWTRMFGMVLLRTEYVLALLLAIFLLGMGLGSLLSRWLPIRAALHALPWISALAVLGSLVAWPWLGQWAGNAQFGSLAQAMAGQGGMLALLTLPATLALGAWLPLLVRHLARGSDGHDTGGSHTSAAWLYGVNSAGAAVGAILAGMVLMPAIGTPATLLLAALLLAVCGMRWVDDQRWWLLLPLFVLLAWPWHRMPSPDKLSPAVADTHQISRFEDAVNVTHVVERPDGQRLLLADLQRMDAATDPTSVEVQKNQARLPLILHPHPKRVLFLGLGTGITAAGSLPWHNLKRTAVELSPGAIAASANAFVLVNGNIDHYTTVVHDDVRRFLRRDTGKYDVIVGDLFHPDMAGRGALLSIEQFRRVRQRLAPGGIFTQWLAMNQFDVAGLKVVMATFHHAFPHGVLFIDGYRLALVARPGTPLRLPVAVPQGGDGGEGWMTWAGRLWGEIPDLNAPLQSEWRPVIEYSLPKLHYRREGRTLVDVWQWLFTLRASNAVALHLLAVPKAQQEEFVRARSATEFNVRSWIAQLLGNDPATRHWLRQAYIANPKNRWASFAVADRLMMAIEQHRLPKGFSRKRALLQLLYIRPDHEQALRAMIALTVDDPVAQQKWRDRLHHIAPLARID